jgi:hypothetical protein
MSHAPRKNSCVAAARREVSLRWAIEVPRSRRRRRTMTAGARLRHHDRIGIIAVAAHLDIARLRGSAGGYHERKTGYQI